MKDKANEKYDILCVGACVQDILLEGLEEKHFKESGYRSGQSHIYLRRGCHQ